MTGIIAEAEARGELGKEGRHQEALFYADNGMVTSSDPRWLQGAFNTLLGLLDRVGLQKNVMKTVGMVCNPCTTAGNLTEEAYGWRVTGVGPTYRERQKGQVACGKCREMLLVGSLSSHLMTQHKRAEGRRRQWNTLTAGFGPHMYQMSFPAKGGPRKCPVVGCPGRVATRTAMRVHFVHRNFLDTMLMLEEGNLPHPWYARCDMLVPRRALNGRQPGTAQCKKGAERKTRRLSEAETWESMERDFKAYREPIKNVTEFKYLGRVLTAGYDDWQEVVRDLEKARRDWGCLDQVLGREGADLKVSRLFYTAFTQAVLLFEAETWVLTSWMEKALDSFQSRVARKITGRKPRQKKDGIWEYPPLAGALREAGMVGIRISITRRQNNVAQYIVTRPILDLCDQATRRPGALVSQRWWEQAGIDLEMARKQAAVSATRSET